MAGGTSGGGARDGGRRAVAIPASQTSAAVEGEWKEEGGPCALRIWQESVATRRLLLDTQNLYLPAPLLVVSEADSAKGWKVVRQVDEKVVYTLEPRGLSMLRVSQAAMGGGKPTYVNFRRLGADAELDASDRGSPSRSKSHSSLPVAKRKAQDTGVRVVEPVNVDTCQDERFDEEDEEEEELEDDDIHEEDLTLPPRTGSELREIIVRTAPENIDGAVPEKFNPTSAAAKDVEKEAAKNVSAPKVSQTHTSENVEAIAARQASIRKCSCSSSRGRDDRDRTGAKSRSPHDPPRRRSRRNRSNGDRGVSTRRSSHTGGRRHRTEGPNSAGDVCGERGSRNQRRRGDGEVVRRRRHERDVEMDVSKGAKPLDKTAQGKKRSRASPVASRSSSSGRGGEAGTHRHDALAQAQTVSTAEAARAKIVAERDAAEMSMAIAAKAVLEEKNFRVAELAAALRAEERRRRAEVERKVEAADKKAREEEELEVQEAARRAKEAREAKILEARRIAEEECQVHLEEFNEREANESNPRLEAADSAFRDAETKLKSLEAELASAERALAAANALASAQRAAAAAAAAARPKKSTSTDDKKGGSDNKKGPRTSRCAETDHGGKGEKSDGARVCARGGDRASSSSSSGSHSYYSESEEGKKVTGKRSSHAVDQGGRGAVRSRGERVGDRGGRAGGNRCEAASRRGNDSSRGGKDDRGNREDRRSRSRHSRRRDRGSGDAPSGGGPRRRNSERCDRRTTAGTTSARDADEHRRDVEDFIKINDIKGTPAERELRELEVHLQKKVLGTDGKHDFHRSNPSARLKLPDNIKSPVGVVLSRCRTLAREDSRRKH